MSKWVEVTAIVRKTFVVELEDEDEVLVALDVVSDEISADEYNISSSVFTKDGDPEELDRLMRFADETLPL